ncbi:unnamed protein product, partial [Didymodactylos carnosus]
MMSALTIERAIGFGSVTNELLYSIGYITKTERDPFDEFIIPLDRIDDFNGSDRESLRQNVKEEQLCQDTRDLFDNQPTLSTNTQSDVMLMHGYTDYIIHNISHRSSSSLTTVTNDENMEKNRIMNNEITAYLSVVIMNWNRPEYVKRIVQLLVNDRRIKEIIIWICNSNPKTFVQFKHRKVKIIKKPEANKQYGLAVRFHGCRMAKYEWVIIQDDDLIITEFDLTRMIEAKQNLPSYEKHRLICFNDDARVRRYTYSKQAPKNHEPFIVCLTRQLLVDRFMCNN